LCHHTKFGVVRQLRLGRRTLARLLPERISGALFACPPMLRTRGVRAV
jgi:hypothetical protein